MTVFSITTVLLALIVCAVLLQPLWRSQRALALTLAAVLLFSGTGLYLQVGTPQALDPAARKIPETTEEAIAQLQAALRREPNQAEGWHLLARQYVRLQQRDNALSAYSRALALDTDNPNLLAEAAEVSAILHPQRLFDAQAEQWLQKALQLDSKHPPALLYSGVMQRQQGLLREAASTWETLLPSLQGEAAMSLHQQINEVRAEAGLAPLPALETGEGAHPIRIDLQWAANANATTQLPPNTTVFVIARVPDGPPMPVAVKRLTLAELPLQLQLDDRDSPMPTLKLSALTEVEVFARISASGTANASADDITTEAVRLRLPATGTVTLQLPNRLPNR